MQLPLEITFRNMKPSEAIEASIRKRAEKLDRFFSHIMSCRVVVEAPHKHHYKGRVYSVRIDLTVPDKELVVSQTPQHSDHEDAYVVIRDAFGAMQRQLESYTAKRRGEVKTHEAPPHGRVIAVFPERNYGHILDSGGREVYFHRNSVLNAKFDVLEIGSEVRFAEAHGDAGPQATSVHVVGKHHIVER